MLWFPYVRLTLTTLLSCDEVLVRLQRDVEPERAYRFFAQETKPFEGWINGASFRIRTLAWYRNTANPIIAGELHAEQDGCAITLRMYPHVAVIIVMLFWLYGTGSILVGAVGAATGWFGGPPSPIAPSWGQAAALGLGGYLLLMGGFAMEVRKVRAYLCQLWDVYEVSIRE